MPLSYIQWIVTLMMSNCLTASQVAEDPTMSSAHEGEEPTIKPVSDVLIK